MKILSIISVFLGLAFVSSAAINPNWVNDEDKPVGSGDYSKANCPPSDAKLFIDFNDVSALIEVGGSLWQNRQSSAAAYEVPLGGGNHVLYSGSIWMGGTDVNDQLKLAAILFRQGEEFWAGPLSQTVGSGDYDPSQPVGFDAVRDYGAATIDPDVCIEYDRFFTIRKQDVINFTLAFECSLNPDCNEEYPVTNQGLSTINNWPAHGDVSRGQDYYLAPFYDYPSEGGAGDGVYDPTQGDIPWFDDILGRDDVECGIDRRVTLFGDITNWWVFNDKGNIHTETHSDPIGMEIHAQAFSFATNDEVNRMTFYNYEMINRSTHILQNTYFAQYADPDLGDPENDYVGCDVSRGLGYAYNGPNFDAGFSGQPGWDANPPAIGIDFFEGPYQDADGRDNVGPRYEEQPDGTIEWVVPTVQEALADEGIVYEGIGIGYSDGIIDNERFGMRRFMYFNRGDLATPGIDDDPQSPGDYYNYMQGIWRDKSPVYYGGTGIGTSVTNYLAKYVYPGDSDPLNFGTDGVDPGFNWSEHDRNGNGDANPHGDRRFLQVAGPFTLTPGAVNNLTVGVVYGRALTGGPVASIEVLKKNDTKAQALFDHCFEIMDPPSAPVLEIVELENELVLLLDNPYGNNINEQYAEEDNINIGDPLDGSIIDKTYTFEGYQIYQMRNIDDGVSDIGNPDQARLVAQCDIKNDIARIINFEFDEELGFAKPAIKVDGANRGIRHSFSIKEDAFTNKALVNHKSYYYIAIAYAHNEFKPYSPTDPTLVDGQQMPYISSRLAADGSAIKAAVGIPHSPKPEADGTIARLPYGSSPEITTLDGRGNGNRAIELTKATEDFIVEHGSIDTPTYKSGKGPINVKVIDPLNLVDGYFLLTFDNYENDIDTAKWTLNRYTEKGGELLGTVNSGRAINYENEQLIPDWGISVTISQNEYAVGGDGATPIIRVAQPIESSLTFADSSLRWLTGINHVDSYEPTNWIMSGSANILTDMQNSNQCDPSAGVFNPCCYESKSNYDDNKLYARILDGTITSGVMVRKNTCGYMPMAFPNINGINYKALGSIESRTMLSVFQPSIDIVFTSDKSKWTRCPVIELGVDANLNLNNGKPGLLRQSPSVDKNGRMPGDPGYNAAEANPDGDTPVGMGWFPGYAIDVETGRRLNMAFGENSFLAGHNGGDMIWNPTSDVYNSSGFPVLGGQHPIYVFGRLDGSKLPNGDIIYPVTVPEYDEGKYIHSKLVTEALADYREVFRDLSWVFRPLLSKGQEILATDARVSVRINQKYNEYEMTGAYNNKPTYEWNMDKYKTIKNDSETLADALDMINVVPNPYYAYSEYERDRLETKVKITNLPERCKVRIYNTSGKLIRAYDKDSPITSLDWDLKNSENIPVSGGVYIIHVEVAGIGNRVVKFFGGMREPDLENL